MASEDPGSSPIGATPTGLCGAEVFDVEDDEEIKISDDIDGETETIKMASDPGKPTQRQVEEHRRTHLPFRSWCRWCVLGRGRGMQHRACIGSIVPIVGLD